MIAGCSKKYFCVFSVSVALFAAFLVLTNISFAQEETLPTDVKLPAGPKETDVYDRQKAIEIASENGGPGNCNSVASCDAYCNTPANQADCMNWARANGVISDENYQKYYNVATSGGPGGCKSTSSCKSYCDDQAHFEECLSFGEKQGLISKEQAEKARKTGPGGCKTQKECRAFCENPQNQDVCIEHAVQEGFMSQAEADRIKEFQARAEEFKKKADEFRRQAEEFKPPEVEEIDPGFDEDKAKQILATQGGPGGCKTLNECEEFCENPNNQEACFTFAEQHDLFEHKEKAEKIKHLIKEGGPGGCRGEKACRQFCENEANFETCISFAEKSGLMSPGEIERAKKGIQALKEGGPAGCKTKDECEKVCQDPSNQEACLEWAKSHGLISEEDARFIEEANKIRGEFESRRHEFESRPPEGFKPPEGFHPPEGVPGNIENAQDCAKYGGEWSGEYCDFGKRECINQGGSWDGKTCNFPKNQIERGPNVLPPPGSEFIGPGGCKTADECQKYCQTNPAACQGFTPPGGGPGYQTAPPTADTSTEECQKQGGDWAGGRCDFGRRECASQGGTWDGSKCNFPPPPSPTSFRDHPFLGAISRYLLK